MTRVIDKLTREEEAQIPLYLEKFRSYGVSTQPIDRASAEAAVTNLYAALSLKKPDKFIWVDSPRSLILTNVLLKDSQLRGQLGSQLWGQLGSQLEGQLGSQLRGQLGSQLGSQLWGQLQNLEWGNIDSYWISFYVFINDILSVKTTPLAQVAHDIVKHCHVFSMFDEGVVLSERPVSLGFDSDNKLHREDGPAILYKDGFSVYALHGKRVSVKEASKLGKALYGAP